MMMQLFELFSVNLPTRRATTRLGKWLAQVVVAGDLILLVGRLGAGKTFLVRSVARNLGLSRDERVTSPTFALIHILATTPPIVHADLYRLSNARQVDALGLRQMRAQGNVVFVEWGENYLSHLGADALVVVFNTSDPQRIATIGWYGLSLDRWAKTMPPSNLIVR